MRLYLLGLFVLIGANRADAIEPWISTKFGPQIVIDGSQTDIFHWKAGSESIRADEEADRENLARQLINRGDWQQLMTARLSNTQTAQTAIQRLDKDGLRVLPDGQIISKYVFVSVVPYIR